MTRTAIRNHVLVVGGVLLVLALLGTHLGLNNGTWWLLVAVAVVAHLGVFAALIAWIIARVRGERRRSG
ncbi:hypothetical protein [Demequina sp.]|uniref:hypothetical protein n=1 Tax=Demequina sp. TaxID=2050685 RepID=UPI0025C2D7C6|nr:hypothetical protein [Demequina sp.]